MEEHADQPDFVNAGLPHAAHRFHQAARRLIDASESLGSCLGRLAERLPARATVRPPLAALVRAGIDCRSAWNEDAARFFAARAGAAKELDALIRSGTAESAHEHVYSMAVDVLPDATELLDDLFPGQSVEEELRGSVTAEERQALRRWPARLTRSDPAYREALELLAARLPRDHVLLRQLLAMEVNPGSPIHETSRPIPAGAYQGDLQDQITAIARQIDDRLPPGLWVERIRVQQWGVPKQRVTEHSTELSHKGRGGSHDVTLDARKVFELIRDRTPREPAKKLAALRAMRDWLAKQRSSS